MFVQQQADDVQVLLQDSMVSKSQVMQIPSNAFLSKPPANMAQLSPVSTDSVSQSLTEPLQGMTKPSTANQNLLLSEPCSPDGLQTKRLRDQAEGF